MTVNAAAQSGEISSLRANITAANAAIAAINVPDLSGNVTTGNVSGFHGNFTQVSGTLLTAAQPNITSIGDLSALTVNGNITTQGIIAGLIIGPLRTGNQPNITGVGTLASLTVTGNINAGNVAGTTGDFTNVSGTIITAAQPNITTVGTLSNLVVAANVDAGNINLAGNISALRVTATNGLVGTLFTGNQSNITRIGTLSNLAVSANANVGNLTANGTVVATNLVGTLLSSSQTNITEIGTLSNITVSNNIILGGNIVTSGNTYVNFKEAYAEVFAATVVSATILNGFVANALQPNITTVGTLTSLAVSGSTVVQSLVSNSTVNASTFYGNTVATTGSYTGNISAGNVSTGQISTTGNVYSAGNITASANITAMNVVLGEVGVFNNVSATIITNLQPYINTIGTLTELRVNGPVEITGTQFVTDDLYITGNLFVNGNTTTVSAGNVTTNDKDLTLANNVVNSTAARNSGLYIGPGGAYGSFYIYDDVWTTANALSVTGNVSTGNVSGSTGTFTNIRGTILDPVQTNITSIGTLGTLTVSGGITGVLLTNSQPFIEQIGTLPNLTVTSNVTTGNVSGATGTFTNVRGTILDAVQTNITTVGNLDQLVVVGNLTSANVSTGLVTATQLRGAILTNSQPFITTVGNLTALNVDGIVTASGFNFSSIGSSFVLANIQVTSNADIYNLNVSGAANLGQISGTLMSNSQPFITEIGTLPSLTVTANVNAGNVSGTTGAFTNVSVANQFVAPTGTFAGNVTTGNVSADTGTFANIRGAILDSVQTNITSIGTLNTLAVTGNISVGNISTNTGIFDNVVANSVTVTSLTVSGNASTGNISGATGTFTNIRGAILDSVQSAITTVGTLTTVNTTGNVTATGNVIAANLVTAGNVYGLLASPSQPYITEIGNLANVNVTGTITGNVVATTLTGILTTTFQPNITTVGTLNSLQVLGNINSQAISATNGVFNELEGRVLTNAQPYINSLGTLTALNVTGNVSSANVVTGNIAVTGNVTSSQNLIAIGSVLGTDFVSNGNVTTLSITVTNDVTANNATLGNNISANNLSLSNTLTAGNTTIANLTVNGNITTVASNIFALGANVQTQSITSNVATFVNVAITGTTEATDAVTGALVVTAGIAANTIWTGDYAVIAGNLGTGGNLQVADNAYFANSIYLNDASGTASGIFSNVANVQLFPSTTTRLEIGGEATTVNIGAISGFGNTTIRNDLTLQGGLFLLGGWGEYGIGNVIINNDLQANNAFLSNSLYLGGGINANAGMTLNGNIVTTGSITSNGPMIVGGSVSQVDVLTANSAVLANIVGIGNQITVGNGSGTAGSQTLRNNFATGTMVVRGGAGIQGNLTIGVVGNSNANVMIHSLATMTGANTGALQVQGGTYIGGNLYVGGETTFVGNVNVGDFNPEQLNDTPIGQLIPASGAFSDIRMSNVRPAIRPTINFDFSNAGTLDPILSYSRTGDATYFDRQGNLRVARPHMPRFTHDSTTGLPLGILIEESRTNILQQSNGFANTQAWSTADSSVSSTTDTDSPDGTFNAFRMVDFAANTLHAIYPNATVQSTLTLGAVYTASAVVKPDEIDQCALLFLGEGDPSIFDLSLGEVATEGPAYRSSIDTLANGWYRIQSTVQKTNTSGNVLLCLADGGTTQFLGTGSQGMYAYGMQLELGEFASSYIPTTATAATRGVDNLTISNAEFLRRYNNQENTVVVDSLLGYRPTSTITNFLRSTLLSFNDGTANNRISMLVENRNAPVDRSGNLVIYTSGVLQTNANITVANLTSTSANTKLAAFFRAGAIGTGFAGNGNVVAGSGNISTAINQMSIGAGPGTSVLNGTISKIQIYSGIVSGNELYNLTRY